MVLIPDSSGERSSVWSVWRDRIISAILAIAVTVIGALAVGWLRANEPHLIFSSTESLPFSGSSGEVSIYQVTLSNDGKKEAYDVACAIRIPDSKIDQYKVTADPLLNVSVSVLGDSLNLQIPNLNPAETIQISLLASATHKLPARSLVALRGRGIVGTERTQSPQESIFGTPPFTALAAAISALMMLPFFTSIVRGKSIVGLIQGSGNDQRQVLAFVCRSNGLRDIADQYSAQIHETTYWAEADRLGQIAADSGDPERMASIERALMAVADCANIEKNSKAIVYYNVALIYRARKDDAGCKKYLALAKKTSQEEVTWRLKVDPRFSLE